MAIKKSQLYSALWAACDALRGGMDASQYKDYVLVVLFLKYISDKAKAGNTTLIEIPEGCAFEDILKLKNKKEIGEELNKKLAKIAEANGLTGIITNADFADENKLGKGKDLVDTVSELLSIFENENLDFSNNRAADDDLIGDAYEYLMRQFATQAGKSKGQFYTPAEVSRIMARIIGIHRDKRNMISIYDPACGSGSLLLRARAEARLGVSLNGQEKDLATIGMAKMSMIIHGVETAELKHGDTLNNPLNTDNATELTQFDYVVANPPFSLKKWRKSASEEDEYRRWGHAMGVPPVPPFNNGDYAFLLHIIASLKSEGTAACILPHGVLFRGNAEGEIREFLITNKYISGVIGLPSNLFFGTGIPACIVVIDKKERLSSTGIFMIDAKEGFKKEGPKNRLREMDIRRIQDAWEARREIPHFSRFVPYEEIEKNDFNLNIPRYIAPFDTEVVQDITAHLRGGLPAHDVEEVLGHYWEAAPSLKSDLFVQQEDGYYRLLPARGEISSVIESSPDYQMQIKNYRDVINRFIGRLEPELDELKREGFDPKERIAHWGNLLLTETAGLSIRDPYEVYEALMNYWEETMQDDCYMISRDGWSITFRTTKNRPTYLDIECDLLPAELLLSEYFGEEVAEIDAADERIEELAARAEELKEEHPDELDGTDKELKTLLKEIEDEETLMILNEYLALAKDISDAKKARNADAKALFNAVMDRYSRLSEHPAEIRRLVIRTKWLPAIKGRCDSLLRDAKHALTSDIRTLADRYAEPLPEIEARLNTLSAKVSTHLQDMGIKL